MRLLLSFAKYTALALLVVAALGAVYQRIAAQADRSNHPAPGQMYNVDGLDMHLDCRGSGEPTIVLEAGLTFGSTSWALVHDALSEGTQVCAYDRAGIDWSEPTDEVLSASIVVERLHGLLTTAEIQPPYLLVGMSAGGIFVREYFRTYPDGVEGMVFVDSSHEQQDNRLPKFDSIETMNNALSLCRWVQPLGLVRAAGFLEDVASQFQLPAPLLEVLLANMNQSHSCKAMLNESHGFIREVVDAEPPASLGDLPLVVLSQGNEPTGMAQLGLTDVMAQQQREVWDLLQQELASLSSRGEQRIAERSGHLIQIEQPDLVIEEINTLVQRLQDEMPHH